MLAGSLHAQTRTETWVLLVRWLDLNRHDAYLEIHCHNLGSLTRAIRRLRRQLILHPPVSTAMALLAGLNP